MNGLQIKNSFRFLLKKKNYLFINVFGLGVGVASFLILALYIYNDISYNRFNENYSRIYRLAEGSGMQTKGLVLPTILDQIPEVECGTRFFTWDGFRVSYNDVAFPQGVQYVDSAFFSVFSFPFTEGNSKNPLKEKYGAVISSDVAKKYFGDTPAVGKKLQIKFTNTFLTVNGVVDVPENSSVKFEIVTSYETGMEISPWIVSVHDWYNTFSESYIVLKEGISPSQIDPKLQRIVTEKFLPVGENKTDLNLFPYSEYHAKYESNGTLIIILSLVALGILGIAIFNYINLTISSSITRSREVGIKKVFGATRHHLFGQIITESYTISFIALIFGYLLAIALLPMFNQLFEINLQFNFSENYIFFFMLLAIWFVVGLISGIVPALFLSRAKLVQSLKGKLNVKNRSLLSQNSLVVVQFTIAIILICVTFLVKNQIGFMIEKDPNFDKENIVVAELETWQYEDANAASNKFSKIAKELKESPYVKSVCFSQTIPGTYSENYNTFYHEASSTVESIHLKKAYVGRNYFETYGIPFTSGSGFNQELSSYKNCVVLNKTAMTKLGYSEAAKQIIRESSPTGQINTIIGAIEDFSYQGAQHEMQPLAHFFAEQEKLSNWGLLSVRANPGASLKVVELLKEKWQNTSPITSVNYFFIDDKLDQHYKEYIRVNKVFSWFSLLAIILSCIGLFTLSAQSMTRKTKEIGIRKVNGAKVSEILAMLNKDFIKWVAIAFVIACPIAWYAMNKWIENFAYKTTLSWWIFALAGVLALIIALLTVSWQSWRAASRNPVEALRYE